MIHDVIEVTVKCTKNKQEQASREEGKITESGSGVKVVQRRHFCHFHSLEATGTSKIRYSNKEINNDWLGWFWGCVCR